MRPYVFSGGTAVVTGAAGGIGAAVTRALADRGSDLVLLDRDGVGLASVAASVRQRHPARRVDPYVVDLADDAASRRIGDELAAAHPGTTLLMNNAGVALGGRFDQVEIEDVEHLMAVNVRAVLRLTHALLPVLQGNPGSHLVTVSSVFGIMAPPGQVAYAASKFAVRGFTEALRAELVQDGVGVTVVHPGGVRTRIAQSARVGARVPRAEYERSRARFERLLRMDPARVAERILTAVERRRPRLLIGASATVPDVLVRLVPGSYPRLLAAAGRRLPR